MYVFEVVYCEDFFWNFGKFGDVVGDEFYEFFFFYVIVDGDVGFVGDEFVE